MSFREYLNEGSSVNIIFASDDDFEDWGDGRPTKIDMFTINKKDLKEHNLDDISGDSDENDVMKIQSLINGKDIKHKKSKVKVTYDDDGYPVIKAKAIFLRPEL